MAYSGVWAEKLGGMRGGARWAPAAERRYSWSDVPITVVTEARRPRICPYEAGMGYIGFSRDQAPSSAGEEGRGCVVGGWEHGRLRLCGFVAGE